MWNAPSDLDYYGQSGFSGDEPEEEQEPELELEPPEGNESQEIEPDPPKTENLENNNDERNSAI
jgi:hypothetical protein